MLLKNYIMAIMLAIFYLTYLKVLVDIAKRLKPEKQKIFLIGLIFKTIFFGIVLNIFLMLLGFIEFNMSNIFVCICLMMLYQLMG